MMAPFHRNIDLKEEGTLCLNWGECDEYMLRGFVHYFQCAVKKKVAILEWFKLSLVSTFNLLLFRVSRLSLREAKVIMKQLRH